MSRLDTETTRKLREMNAGDLLEAIDSQVETLSMGLPFEERVRLIVDDAYSSFTHAKVTGLIRRAGLRYPNADLRRIDLLDERGLDRNVLAQLGSCSFVGRQQNVVFQGFTGSGKSYLGCALAKRAWVAAQDQTGGAGKFLRKYSSFTLLVIDEWLLDRPTDSMRGMLLELMERRYGETSTVFCTQYLQKDWHQRLGASVHADAIMDRIVHNTVWVETGSFNMREHTALIDA